ncbi:MAG: translocation/assembly module TamB domain-containing protein [Saprospiraceae bacterium]
MSWKHVARKALKIFLWLVGIIVILIFLCLLLLQTCYIQNLVKNKAVHFLENKLGTPVAIAKLGVDFPKRIVLEGVYFGDQKGDTLLAGDTMKVDINMWKLLSREILIDEIDLRGITSHVKRTISDSTYNFDYILKAFASKSSSPTDTTSSKIMSLHKINLERINVKYIDEITGQDVTASLSHFDTDISEFDYIHQKYDVPRITLNGMQLKLRQTKALSTKTISTDTFNISPPFTLPDVKMKEMDISDIHFDYGNSVTAMDSKLDLGKLHVEINNLDLPNQKIEIKQIAIGKTDVDISLGRIAQKAVKATTTEVVTTLQKGWIVNLSKLELDTINLKYDDLNAKPQRSGVDYSHLDLMDLVTSISDVAYTPDTIYGKVNQLTAREKSGLEIKKFIAEVGYGKNTTRLDHFVIETPLSHLSDQITLTYSSIDALSKDPGSLGIQGHFLDNTIAVSDILLFAPSIASQDPIRKNKNSSLHINGSVDGKVSDLLLNDISMTGIGQINIAASGRITGLPNVSKSYFDLHINQFSASVADLNDLIPAGSIPSNFRLPDYIKANGDFKGSLNNFSTNLHTTSEYGPADINASLENMTVKGKESYDATIHASQFNLGRLIRQEDKLGRITLSGSIKGNGTDPKTLNATIQGSIASMQYSDYNYKNLSLDGIAKAGDLSVKAKMTDPNITFDLDAKANMNGSYPALNLILNADTINLQALNFSKKDLSLHGKIEADLQTADPDYLNGTIYITDALISLDGKRYKPDTIQIKSVATEGEDSLQLRSEFLTANLTGQYNLTDISASLQSTIDRYFNTRPATDTLINSKPQRIAFTAKLIRSPLVQDLVPDLEEMEDATFNGKFDSETKEITFSGNIPRLRYKDYTINNLALDLVTKNNALNYSFKFDDLNSPQFRILTTSLSGKAQNNILDVNLQVRDNDDKEQYRIAGELSSARKLFEFKMLPDGLTLNYTPWNVEADNAIAYGSEGWMLRNFKVSNDGQSMTLNSEPQELNAPINAEFKDFKIETFTRLISKDSLLAGGILNGQANIRNLNTNPVFTADLAIKDFSFHADTVGDISLKVNNEKANTYTADVAVTGYGNEVKMNGYFFDDGTKNLYDLNIDLAHLNMKSFEAFTSGELNNSSGTVTGKLHLKGTLLVPEITGDLHLHDAGFTISRFNSYYTAPDENFAFTNEGLRFNHFTLVDSTGNHAVLDGMVFTRDFKDYRFGLTLQANNFQILNSTRQNNKLYYGKLFMDAQLRINGGINTPVVDGSIRINDKTNLTIVIPQDDPGLVEREGIVQFVDMDTIHDVMAVSVPDSIIKSELVGMNVAVNIIIDKNAELNLIIDEANGDYLNVKGEGNLSGGIDPSGKLALTGMYELQEGEYRFSFNQVKREFLIQKGSTISWTGDPYNADVNVTAVYKANIAPLSLVQSQLADAEQNVVNTYKQKLPFDMLLNMNGALMKPDITFDIDLPPGNYGVSNDIVSTVQSRLAQLRTEPSELNKQVFAVLLLNRFISDDPFQNQPGEGGISSLARQSASKLLSEQLNKLIGGKIAGFDVTFDINSIEDYTTGELKNRTDVNVGLSKQLLDDRLKVSVGSNFELEGPQQADRKTTNIAGDVSAEFQLTKDGKYLLRAYRKDEYIVVQGQVVETGLGFAFTTDYEKFKDIFEKKTEEFKQMKKEERQTRKDERKE